MEDDPPASDIYSPSLVSVVSDDSEQVTALPEEESRNDYLLHARVMPPGDPPAGTVVITGVVDGIDRGRFFGERLYHVTYTDDDEQHFTRAEILTLLMDSEDDAGSDSSPSHDAGARRRGECPVLRPARAASATAATSSSVPLAGFPATGWEVKLAMGRWIAWQPGVAFRGEVGEQVEYSWGPYRYIARITSTNSGVQRNVDNGTEHPFAVP